MTLTNDILFSFRCVLEYAIEELCPKVSLFLSDPRGKVALLSIRIFGEDGRILEELVDETPVTAQNIARLVEFVYDLVYEGCTEEVAIKSLKQIANLLSNENKLRKGFNGE